MTAPQVIELPVPVSEGRLLELAREEKLVFRRLAYDRYAATVNRLVWRLLGADSEHEDVVHLVFLEIFRGLKKVREAEQLGAWVRAVTVNVVRGELRRRTWRRRLFAAEAEHEFAESPSNAESVLLLRRAFAILDHMSPSDRTAFILRRVECAEIGEIAQAMGCSRSTVERKLRRAEASFFKQAARDSYLKERLVGSLGGL